MRYLESFKDLQTTDDCTPIVLEPAYLKKLTAYVESKGYNVINKMTPFQTLATYAESKGYPKTPMGRAIPTLRSHIQKSS